MQAILDECEAQGISKQDALEYLLRRTLLYAEAVSRWPPHEQRFAANLTRWFAQHEYRADPKEWERPSDPKVTGQKGGKNGNGAYRNKAEQRQLDNLEACAKAKASIMAG